SALVHGVPECVARGADFEDDDTEPAPDAGWRVGIDQGVWDPDTQTLYVEAAEILDQHTRYALFVTRAVKSCEVGSAGACKVPGDPIATPKAFSQAIGDDADEDHAATDERESAYRASLRKAVGLARFFGLKRKDIAVASVFTTMSVTSVLEKIHAQIAATPAPVPNFKIARAGTSAVSPCDAPANPCRTAVFDLSTIIDNPPGVTVNREIDIGGPLSPQSGSGRLRLLKDLVPG